MNETKPSAKDNLRTAAHSIQSAIRPLVAPLSAIEPTRKLPRRYAWVLALSAFLIGFGPSVIYAVIFLFTRSRGVGYPSWEAALTPILTNITSTGAIVLLAVVVGWHLTGRNPAPWHGVRNELRAGAVPLFFVATSFALADLTNSLFGLKTAFPQLPDTGLDNATDFVGSALAGFGEEPLFTLLIPLTLRASGMHWRRIIVVSALLRVSFHIYYGPGAIWLALWAAAAVVVVARTGCVWGVALMHSIHDLTNSAQAHLSYGSVPVLIIGWGLQLWFIAAAGLAITNRVGAIVHLPNGPGELETKQSRGPWQTVVRAYQGVKHRPRKRTVR